MLEKADLTAAVAALRARGGVKQILLELKAELKAGGVIPIGMEKAEIIAAVTALRAEQVDLRKRINSLLLGNENYYTI